MELADSFDTDLEENSHWCCFEAAYWQCLNC